MGGLPDKTRLGPPGVDTKAFRPLPVDEAAEALEGLASRLEGAEAASWGGDAGAAAALHRLDPRRDRIVSYVGKLIVSKGVDLLLAAWPLVHRRVPEAELIVVGFGEYRKGLERLRDALGARRPGRRARGRPPGTRARGRPGGRAGVPGRVPRRRFPRATPTRRGRRWSAWRSPGGWSTRTCPTCCAPAQAQVVPSTFPEAFGMVAAEAAACGALPVAAEHSGLAEVARTFAPEVSDQVRRLLTFERGPDAVAQIADRLVSWLELDPEERERATSALARVAHERYSWEGVARGVIAAAEGRLDELLEPAA